MTMPVYANKTGHAVTVPGNNRNVTFLDGQALRVDFFIPSEYGLMLVNESPLVKPQIMKSETITLNNGDFHEIVIPQCESFGISILCKVGDADVRENYQNATIAVRVDQICAFQATYRRCDVGSIWLEGASDNTEIAYIVSHLG